MATSFSEASEVVLAMAKDLIADHYHDLVAADVRITYLFARNPNAPALTKNSWPAKALVRLNNLRDRVAGLRDCTILIDEDGWQGWTEEHRAAVLDHELNHLEVLRNKAGAFRYDDANRPKLRLKPHDFELTGFHSIVARHGVQSAECMGFEAVIKVWEQMEFPFMGKVKVKS